MNLDRLSSALQLDKQLMAGVKKKKKSEAKRRHLLIDSRTRLKGRVCN